MFLGTRSIGSKDLDYGRFRATAVVHEMSRDGTLAGQDLATWRVDLPGRQGNESSEPINIL